MLKSFWLACNELIVMVTPFGTQTLKFNLLMRSVIPVFIIWFLGLPAVFGQGTVNFDLSVFGTTTSVRVYDSQGVALAGTGFRTQLYAADGTNANQPDLSAKGRPVFMRNGLGAGWNQISGIGPDGTNVSKSVTVTDVSGGPTSVGE